MIKAQKTFVIVGLGLIGGSYAQGLTAAGHTVYGLDTNPETIAYAVDHGLIRRGATVPDPALLAQAQVVVLGLYPQALIQWVEQYQPLLPAGTLLTDVCGVKGQVVTRVQNMLRPDLEFIGCHPMAGKEVSGVEHSDAAIFRGANFIITPTAANTPAAIQSAWEIGETLGFRTISLLDPATHDRMVGFLSQLTHAIAVSLMNCNDNPHLAAYTGDSFRDLTRIARINEDLWSELFLLNRQVLEEEIDNFTRELTHLKSLLEAGDKAGLKQLFIRSTQRRKEFDRG